MTSPVKIVPTTTDDLPFIYNLFDLSIEYQEQKGFPVWRGYDKSSLLNDAHHGNQYKIIVDNEIAMAFSVCYSDTVIWREMENGTSVYLHRIVVNPIFKGQKLFGKVLRWTTDHARAKGLSSIRMDTWDNNPTLIDYYLSFGFRLIGHFVTPDTPELPAHNRKLPIVLMEKKI